MSRSGTQAPDLDTADPAEAARCRSLWATVLLIALADAERDAAARAWFRSPDFQMVASLAGLDEDAACDLARRMTSPAALEN